MRLQLAVAAPELVAPPTYRLALARRTRTARVGLAHLHDINPDIPEREVETVEELSMLTGRRR